MATSPRRVGAAAAAALVVLGAVAVVVVALSRGGPPASPATIEVRGRIVDAVGAAGRIWTLTCTQRCGDPRRSSGRLLGIDPRTGRVRSTAVVDSPQALAAGAGGIWTADFWHGTVTRFNPRTGARLATVALRLPGRAGAVRPSALTVGDGELWVSTGAGYVVRIDPVTNRVATAVKVPGAATGPVVAGGGAVFVGRGTHLGRLDPATRRVSQSAIGARGGRGLSIGALALAGGALWVGGEWARPAPGASGGRKPLLTGEAVLAEVDPAGGAVRAVSAMPSGTALQGRGGRLWLTNVRRAELSEFDARARRIVAAAHVRATGAVIPWRGDRVWVVRSATGLARVELAGRP